MGFGKSNEVKEGGSRKFFTGVENFKVMAVNPSKDELEALYGREISYEPEYIGTQTVKDGDGEREVEQLRLDFYLDNDDAGNTITTKASFYVMNTHHMSQTGKVKVINDFGKTTWLTKDQIQSKDVPDNMSWYNTSGLKVAKRGEEEVIDFIANLLNLPWDLTKMGDPSDGHAKFEKDKWADMFKGNFLYLQSIIETTNNKVGLALGVKVADDQSLRQTVCTKKSLRQYVLSGNRANKFQYLAKSIDEAKANGAYGTTDFGPQDYNLREYSITPTKMDANTLPPAEDIFANNTSSDVAVAEESWLDE